MGVSTEPSEEPRSGVSRIINNGRRVFSEVNEGEGVDWGGLVDGRVRGARNRDARPALGRAPLGMPPAS